MSARVSLQARVDQYLAERRLLGFKLDNMARRLASFARHVANAGHVGTLTVELGWVDRGSHGTPRIHDLRHSFAVRRLVLWHEQGEDINQRMLALSTYLGHAKVSSTYWYLSGVPELRACSARRLSAMPAPGRTAMSKPATPRAPPSFAALVQSFFTEHLTQQRAMSPRTVATYRDGFVLFLDFATANLHKQPTAMKLQDITPALILAFLDHLEQSRGNAARTRNARLAALRAFLKFAGHRDVNALHVAEQGLGVPMKRFERPMLGFLSREEMLAIIGQPGARTLRPLQAAAVTYRIAFGPRAGQKVLTLRGAMPREDWARQPLCADIDGFSLHAAVRVEAHDRKRLEQLCRYITRPALSDERVQVNAAGQVELKLKTPWRDGTTHLVMSPLEFMQRLAALVPRPRLHLIRFHGVLAPNAKLRPLVVPQGPHVQEPASEAAAPAECEVDTVQARPTRISWARLLKRVFDIDMQHCPNCGGGELKIIAAILRGEPGHERS